jgi:hypothetical protein
VGEESEDELPDTKKLITQLNLGSVPTDAASVFEDELLGGEMNDEDVSNLK